MCKVPNVTQLVETSRPVYGKPSTDSQFNQAAVMQNISDFLPSPTESWDEDFPYEQPEYAYNHSFSELTMGKFKSETPSFVKTEDDYNELLVPSLSPSESPSHEWQEDISAAYVPEDNDAFNFQSLPADFVPYHPIKEMKPKAIPSLPSQLPTQQFKIQTHQDVNAILPSSINTKHQIQPSNTQITKCPKSNNKPQPQKVVAKKVQSQEAKITKRERNRLAAERYRRKGRELVETLTTKCNGLENENQELKFRSSKLEEEVCYLRDLITKLTSSTSTGQNF